MKSRLWIGSLFSILTLLLATPAMAHTKLVQTTPGSGEVITQVKEIKLSFSENILPVSTLQVKNQQGETVGLKPIHPDGKEMTGLPEKTLPPNHYTVLWKAAAEDGHISEGSFSFDVQGSASGKAPDTTKPIDNSNSAPTSNGSDPSSHTQTLIGILACAMVILAGVVFFSLRGKRKV